MDLQLMHEFKLANFCNENDRNHQAMNFAENDEAAKRLKAMLKAPSESGETEKKSIRKRKHEVSILLNKLVSCLSGYTELSKIL